jgi:transposase-like protein
MARKPAVSDETKTQIVKDVLGGEAVTVVAAKYGVSASAVYAWARPTKHGVRKLRRRDRPIKVQPDLSSVIEDVALGRKFKEFIAALGYTKR